jgi:gluconolactonase
MTSVTVPAPVGVQQLTRVVETDAHEGPVYVTGEDALYFTTRRPDVAIKRLALDGGRFPLEPGRITTVRAATNVANGMALDAEGRLVVCEQGTLWESAAITRVDRATGSVETVVDKWLGLRLNSPNDVVVKRDGTIWFTDPSYGYLQGFRPAPQVGDHVYRYDPRSGALSVVADGFDKPNGLAFSPREDVLYVGDNGNPRHIVAFDVLHGRRLTRGRVLAGSTPEHPDGLKVDADGRVYASAADGVRIFDPSGDQLGTIAVPGAVNFTFGGPDRNVLFITADDAIWAAVLDTAGPPAWRGRPAVRPAAGAANSAGPSHTSPIGSTADDAHRCPALEGVRR